MYIYIYIYVFQIPSIKLFFAPAALEFPNHAASAVSLSLPYLSSCRSHQPPSLQETVWMQTIKPVDESDPAAGGKLAKSRSSVHCCLQ